MGGEGALKQAQNANSNSAGLLQLHQDGSPFAMPSKRGMDPSAPDFDAEAFLDLLGEDVMHIQHEVLREILELQADVEYLRRHGLNGRTDAESFRKSVPVVSYADMEADILKVVNGESSASIFTVDPISHFHLSSGTTRGKPKYIPITTCRVGDMLGFSPFEVSLYRRLRPGPTGKVLNIAFAAKLKTTPSGLKAGAMSAHMYRNPRFLDREKGPDDEYCVPNEVILCDDTTQGTYCHLLCTLARAPEIIGVSSFLQLPSWGPPVHCKNNGERLQRTSDQAR